MKSHTILHRSNIHGLRCWGNALPEMGAPCFTTEPPAGKGVWLYASQLSTISDLTDLPGSWAKPACWRPREEQIQQSIAVGRMSFHKHHLVEQVEERTGEDDGLVGTGPGWEGWLLPRERKFALCPSTTWTPSQGLHAEAHPVAEPRCPSSPSPSCS